MADKHQDTPRKVKTDASPERKKTPRRSCTSKDKTSPSTSVEKLGTFLTVPLSPKAKSADSLTPSKPKRSQALSLKSGIPKSSSVSSGLKSPRSQTLKPKPSPSKLKLSPSSSSKSDTVLNSPKSPTTSSLRDISSPNKPKLRRSPRLSKTDSTTPKLPTKHKYESSNTLRVPKSPSKSTDSPASSSSPRSPNHKARTSKLLTPKVPSSAKIKKDSHETSRPETRSVTASKPKIKSVITKLQKSPNTKTTTPSPRTRKSSIKPKVKSTPDSESSLADVENSTSPNSSTDTEIVSVSTKADSDSSPSGPKKVVLGPNKADENQPFNKPKPMVPRPNRPDLPMPEDPPLVRPIPIRPKVKTDAEDKKPEEVVVEYQRPVLIDVEPVDFPGSPYGWNAPYKLWTNDANYEDPYSVRDIREKPNLTRLIHGKWSQVYRWPEDHTERDEPCTITFELPSKLETVLYGCKCDPDMLEKLSPVKIFTKDNTEVMLCQLVNSEEDVQEALDLVTCNCHPNSAVKKLVILTLNENYILHYQKYPGVAYTENCPNTVHLLYRGFPSMVEIEHQVRGLQLRNRNGSATFKIKYKE